MRVLILGDAAGNSGPSNVHRKFLEHWPVSDQVDYVHAQDKLAFMREAIGKGAKADVVLSPLINFPCIAAQDALHALGKPIVCFNHGYIPFENDVNGMGHGRWWLNRYRAALRGAERVVANSGFQRDFVLRHQPELNGRIEGLTLGIDRFEQEESLADGARPIVAVTGGNRYVKGNDVVARASATLVGRAGGVDLKVYGRKYASGEACFKELPDGFGLDCMVGHVDHGQFLRDLNQSSLFVMNSRHDSFGLSLFDALREGCSVLVSRNCGALEVLRTEDCDVVEDCEDVQEVADKMAYLLEHPNAKRLYSTIDFDACSWDRQVARLREICAQVVADKRGGGKR